MKTIKNILKDLPLYILQTPTLNITYLKMGTYKNISMIIFSDKSDT